MAMAFAFAVGMAGITGAVPVRLYADDEPVSSEAPAGEGNPGVGNPAENTGNKTAGGGTETGAGNEAGAAGEGASGGEGSTVSGGGDVSGESGAGAESGATSGNVSEEGEGGGPAESGSSVSGSSQNPAAGSESEIPGSAGSSSGSSGDVSGSAEDAAVYPQASSQEMEQMQKAAEEYYAQTEGASIGAVFTPQTAEKMGKKKRTWLFIGDSRTVGMYQTIGDNGVLWDCKGGMGYSWMTETAVPQAEPYIDGNTDVVILMGVNDAWDRLGPTYAPMYISYLNKKAAQWAKLGARTFYVSVNPVRGTFELNGYYLNNFFVERWNNWMKKGLSGDITYIDTCSGLEKNPIAWADDIHYLGETNQQIYDQIAGALQSDQEALKATALRNSEPDHKIVRAAAVKPFLRALYQSGYHREASAEEMDYWSDTVAEGKSVSQVAAALLVSGECGCMGWGRMNYLTWMA